ncbi:MAG: hypothetical protein IJB29_06880 [Mailhella sp.]|nr:hypothetical protein [Mailhella sp.]
MDILIVTPRRDFWEILKSPFEERGAAVRMAGDIEEALASLHEARAALAVLDLFGGEAWDAAKHADALRSAVIRILMQDAMTNTASVCGMGDETFHDAMEGLGMISDLPAQPGEQDVKKLMDALLTILG